MLELEHGFRVVDVNARLEPDPEAVAAHGREISPERLERELHQAGVIGAIVSPGTRPENEGYLQANNAVARLSVDRPFYAFARINGPRESSHSASARLRNLRISREEYHTAPSDVEQYAYDDRFYGFSLDPVHDGLPDEETMAQLDDVGLPVVVETGQQYTPRTVAESLLQREFPVIMTGFGGFPLDRRLMNDAIDLLEEYDQLYLETSFVRYRDVLERGLLEHPDRILFGSGVPDTHPNVGVMEILTLDVSEDLMRRVFSKNPSRLIPALSPGET